MTGGAAAIPPLVVEFTVATDADHAFRTFVEDAGLWWPPGHTRSGAPTTIIFEPSVGGRVFERDAAGAEHDWGEVLEWDPPAGIQLRWHHVFPRDEATNLSVTFHPTAGGTLVRLLQTGWDALDHDEAARRRQQTIGGWTAVTTGYRQRLDQGATPP